MKQLALRLVWPLIALLCTACHAEDVQKAPTAAAAAPTPPGELVIIDVLPGDGAAVTPGSIAVVHYTGWLYEEGATDKKGNKFDSSLDTNRPFRFQLGASQVIQGWDKGVAGMKVGGKRRLIIPAALAYGDSGAGNVIPPGATLVFDVELLAIENPSPQ